MEPAQGVLKILRELQVIREGHFVYTSGRHGSKYVDKDKIYPSPHTTDELCRKLALKFFERFGDTRSGVVVAPAVGGINLSQGVARYLCNYTGYLVRSVYAEREEISLLKPIGKHQITIDGAVAVVSDGQLLIKRDKFVFKRGYDKMIPGSTVLVVEDIITTGGTVKGVLEAVRQLDGKIIGVGALCNRGGLKAEDFGDIGLFVPLVNLQLDSWPEEDCPLCKNQVPINTDVGKGKEFLQRHNAK